MINFLYKFQKILTLPATYMKFVVERTFCMFLGLPPADDDEFDSSQSFGHARHSEPHYVRMCVLFCFLPSFVMAFVGFVSYLSGFIPLIYLGVRQTDYFTGVTSLTYYIYIGFIYLGIIFLSNVFPTMADTRILWDMVFRNYDIRPIVKVFAFLPCALLRLGSVLERYGVTLLMLIALPVLGVYLQQ